MLSGDYVTDYYADGSRRFLPILRRNGSGDLAVQLEGGGAHVLATGADADDYHTHVVRFNPLTDDATYYFDGTPIETWAGSATAQRQITFGQGASFIAGQAYYQSMSFEPAPEPSTALMLAVGTLAIAAASGRRRVGSGRV